MRELTALGTKGAFEIPERWVFGVYLPEEGRTLEFSVLCACTFVIYCRFQGLNEGPWEIRHVGTLNTGNRLSLKFSSQRSKDLGNQVFGEF